MNHYRSNFYFLLKRYHTHALNCCWEYGNMIFNIVGCNSHCIPVCPHDIPVYPHHIIPIDIDCWFIPPFSQFNPMNNKNRCNAKLRFCFHDRRHGLHRGCHAGDVHRGGFCSGAPGCHGRGHGVCRLQPGQLGSIWIWIKRSYKWLEGHI